MTENKAGHVRIVNMKYKVGAVVDAWQGVYSRQAVCQQGMNDK